MSWCPKTQANDAIYNWGPSNNPPERSPNFRSSPVVAFRENRNNYFRRGCLKFRPSWLLVLWLILFGAAAIVSALADVVAGVMTATATEKTPHNKSFVI